MIDLLAPVLNQIHKLWARVDRMPVVRWATVVQVSPLRVMLDGDLDVLPFTPASLVRDVAVGARVVCVEQNRRVIIIDTPRTGALVRFGSAFATTGDQIGITATVTEVTGTSVAFDLSEPMTVVLNATITTSSTDAADAVSVIVRDGVTAMNEGRAPANSSPVTAGTPHHQALSAELTLTAGTHRLNLAVRRSTGTGSITVHKNPLNPARLTVDRIL